MSSPLSVYRPWLEVAAVCAAGFIPGMPSPLIAMLAVASVLHWVAGRSAGGGGGQAPPLSGVRDIGAGIVVGALAFVGVTLVVGAEMTGSFAVVRGNPEALPIVLLLSSALAVAAEMVFRGFVLERVAVASGHRWHLANVVAAIASGVVVGAAAGPVAMLGAAILGLGFGYLYIGAGRRVLLPAIAHATFDAAAIIAAALKL